MRRNVKYYLEIAVVTSIVNFSLKDSRFATHVLLIVSWVLIFYLKQFNFTGALSIEPELPKPFNFDWKIIKMDFSLLLPLTDVFVEIQLRLSSMEPLSMYNSVGSLFTSM